MNPTPTQSRPQPVAAHTPCPWHIESDTDICSADFRVPFVASTHFPGSDVGTALEYANAAFIVRACNGYQADQAKIAALVAACLAARAELIADAEHFPQSEFPTIHSALGLVQSALQLAKE